MAMKAELQDRFRPIKPSPIRTEDKSKFSTDEEEKPRQHHFSPRTPQVRPHARRTMVKACSTDEECSVRETTPSPNRVTKLRSPRGSSLGPRPQSQSRTSLMSQSYPPDSPRGTRGSRPHPRGIRTRASQVNPSDDGVVKQPTARKSPRVRGTACKVKQEEEKEPPDIDSNKDKNRERVKMSKSGAKSEGCSDVESTTTDDEEDEKVLERSENGKYIKYSTIIGKGAFKNVYKGCDSTTGELIAWCELQNTKKGEERERFKAEAEILKGLNHANIVRYYDYWERKGTVVLVTEMMNSGTLKTFLKNLNQIKPKVLKKYSRQILRGLNYLHTQKPPIVHRDLKCDNIFINGSDASVKIGDLGLATFRVRSTVKSVIGTPEFMAPEMYEESYNEKVDVYSFGMCLIEMATMEYPYLECAGPMQILRKVTRGEPPDCLQKVEDPELKDIILWCVQPNPVERPTVNDVLSHPFFLEDPEKDPGFTLEVQNKDDAADPQNSIVQFQLKVMDNNKKGANYPDELAIAFPVDIEKDSIADVVDMMVKLRYITQKAAELIKRHMELRLSVVKCLKKDRLRRGVVPEDKGPVLLMQQLTNKQIPANLVLEPAPKDTRLPPRKGDQNFRGNLQPLQTVKEEPSRPNQKVLSPLEAPIQTPFQTGMNDGRPQFQPSVQQCFPVQTPHIPQLEKDLSRPLIVETTPAPGFQPAFEEVGNPINVQGGPSVAQPQTEQGRRPIPEAFYQQCAPQAEPEPKLLENQTQYYPVFQPPAQQTAANLPTRRPSIESESSNPLMGQQMPVNATAQQTSTNLRDVQGAPIDTMMRQQMTGEPSQFTDMNYSYVDPAVNSAQTIASVNANLASAQVQDMRQTYGNAPNQFTAPMPTYHESVQQQHHAHSVLPTGMQQQGAPQHDYPDNSTGPLANSQIPLSVNHLQQQSQIGFENLLNQTVQEMKAEQRVFDEQNQILASKNIPQSAYQNTQPSAITQQYAVPHDSQQQYKMPVEQSITDQLMQHSIPSSAGLQQNGKMMSPAGIVSQHQTDRACGSQEAHSASGQQIEYQQLNLTYSQVVKQQLPENVYHTSDGLQRGNQPEMTPQNQALVMTKGEHLHMTAHHQAGPFIQQQSANPPMQNTDENTGAQQVSALSVPAGIAPQYQQTFDSMQLNSESQPLLKQQMSSQSMLYQTQQPANQMAPLNPVAPQVWKPENPASAAVFAAQQQQYPLVGSTAVPQGSQNATVSNQHQTQEHYAGVGVTSQSLLLDNFSQARSVIHQETQQSMSQPKTESQHQQFVQQNLGFQPQQLAPASNQQSSNSIMQQTVQLQQMQGQQAFQPTTKIPQKADQQLTMEQRPSAPQTQQKPPQQSMPHVQQSAPQMQQQAPQMQHPAPQIQQPAPQIQQPASQIQQPAPQIQQVMPQIQQSTPQMQQPALQIQQPASQIQQPAPQIQQPAPQMQQPAPQRQQPASQIQQPAPQIQQPASQIQQSVPQMQQPVPQMQQPVPQMQQPVPQMQQPALQIQQPAPQIQQPAPQRQQPAPQMQQPASQMQQPVPQVQQHAQQMQQPLAQMQQPQIQQSAPQPQQPIPQTEKSTSQMLKSGPQMQQQPTSQQVQQPPQLQMSNQQMQSQIQSQSSVQQMQHPTPQQVQQSAPQQMSNQQMHHQIHNQSSVQQMHQPTSQQAQQPVLQQIANQQLQHQIQISQSQLSAQQKQQPAAQQVQQPAPQQMTNQQLHHQIQMSQSHPAAQHLQQPVPQQLPPQQLANQQLQHPNQMPQSQQLPLQQGLSSKIDPSKQDFQFSQQFVQGYYQEQQQQQKLPQAQQQSSLHLPPREVSSIVDDPKRLQESQLLGNQQPDSVQERTSAVPQQLQNSNKQQVSPNQQQQQQQAEVLTAQQLVQMQQQQDMELLKRQEFQAIHQQGSHQVQQILQQQHQQFPGQAPFKVATQNQQDNQLYQQQFAHPAYQQSSQYPQQQANVLNQPLQQVPPQQNMEQMRQLPPAMQPQQHQPIQTQMPQQQYQTQVMQGMQQAQIAEQVKKPESEINQQQAAYFSQQHQQLQQQADQTGRQETILQTSMMSAEQQHQVQQQSAFQQQIQSLMSKQFIQQGMPQNSEQYQMFMMHQAQQMQQPESQRVVLSQQQQQQQQAVQVQDQSSSRPICNVLQQQQSQQIAQQSESTEKQTVVKTDPTSLQFSDRQRPQGQFDQPQQPTSMHHHQLNAHQQVSQPQHSVHQPVQLGIDAAQNGGNLSQRYYMPQDQNVQHFQQLVYQVPYQGMHGQLTSPDNANQQYPVQQLMQIQSQPGQPQLLQTHVQQFGGPGTVPEHQFQQQQQRPAQPILDRPQQAQQMLSAEAGYTQQIQHQQQQQYYIQQQGQESSHPSQQYHQMPPHPQFQPVPQAQPSQGCQQPSSQLQQSHQQQQNQKPSVEQQQGMQFVQQQQGFSNQMQNPSAAAALAQAQAMKVNPQLSNEMNQLVGQLLHSSLAQIQQAISTTDSKMKTQVYAEQNVARADSVPASTEALSSKPLQQQSQQGLPNAVFYPQEGQTKQTPMSMGVASETSRGMTQGATLGHSTFTEMVPEHMAYPQQNVGTQQAQQVMQPQSAPLPKPVATNECNTYQQGQTQQFQYLNQTNTSQQNLAQFQGDITSAYPPTVAPVASYPSVVHGPAHIESGVEVLRSDVHDSPSQPSIQPPVISTISTTPPRTSQSQDLAFSVAAHSTSTPVASLSGSPYNTAVRDGLVTSPICDSTQRITRVDGIAALPPHPPHATPESKSTERTVVGQSNHPLQDSLASLITRPSTPDTHESMDSCGEAAEHAEPGRPRRSARSRRGGVRSPILTVLSIEGTVVECQLDVSKKKIVNFKFDREAEIDVPSIANTLVSKNLMTSQLVSNFIDLMNELLTKLAAEPDKIPVLEGATNKKREETSASPSRNRTSLSSHSRPPLPRRAESVETPLSGSCSPSLSALSSLVQSPQSTLTDKPSVVDFRRSDESKRSGGSSPLPPVTPALVVPSDSSSNSSLTVETPKVRKISRFLVKTVPDPLKTTPPTPLVTPDQGKKDDHSLDIPQSHPPNLEETPSVRSDDLQKETHLSVQMDTNLLFSTEERKSEEKDAKAQVVTFGDVPPFALPGCSCIETSRNHIGASALDGGIGGLHGDEYSSYANSRDSGFAELNRVQILEVTTRNLSDLLESETTVSISEDESTPHSALQTLDTEVSSPDGPALDPIAERAWEGDPDVLFAPVRCPSKPQKSASLSHPLDPRSLSQELEKLRRPSSLPMSPADEVVPFSGSGLARFRSHERLPAKLSDAEVQTEVERVERKKSRFRVNAVSAERELNQGGRKISANSALNVIMSEVYGEVATSIDEKEPRIQEVLRRHMEERAAFFERQKQELQALVRSDQSQSSEISTLSSATLEDSPDGLREPQERIHHLRDRCLDSETPSSNQSNTWHGDQTGGSPSLRRHLERLQGDSQSSSAGTSPTNQKRKVFDEDFFKLVNTLASSRTPSQVNLVRPSLNQLRSGAVFVARVSESPSTEGPSSLK